MDGGEFMRRLGTYIRNHHLGLIAIFIALSGTAIAAGQKAPKNSVVTKSIKKAAVTKAKLAPNSVDGSKVVDHSLTGADIDLASLGSVPSATTATSAATATNATHATNADHADNAGKAADADQLGGSPPSAYLKSTDSIPGGQVGGTYAAPTLRGSGFGTAGPSTLFAPEGCGAASAVSGPSVTITVPASGLVEILARVQFQTVGGNVLNACLLEDNASPFTVLTSNSVVADTRYTLAGSTNGTTNENLAEWIPLFTSPGPHTFKLAYGRSGGGSGTNQVTNRLLLVRALS